MELRDVDRLILVLLLEIHRKLRIEDGLNSALIEKALSGGHLWALKWELPGIFHGHIDSERELRETLDILDMWDDLEHSFEALSASDKAAVAKDAAPFGERVRFHGFDGNGGAHLGIARFLIEELGRFSHFKGRELNSHAPLLEADLRMLSAYGPLRKASPMGFGRLTASQIAAALKEMRHPEHR
ncbi:YfbU family protein [Plastoroseomonas hellenica]|uniref:YfbU family protein n=1 Tax=Plastoroseomonas hellenica TaxID=2687306 RepID=UPI001BAA2FB5|nr:YfbU family protein [Plastoroseomonas hellenica]MBR0647125.1 hypothetical protein [Plastoroseomonas hellenica]